MDVLLAEPGEQRAIVICLAAPAAFHQLKWRWNVFHIPYMLLGLVENERATLKKYRCVHSA